MWKYLRWTEILLAACLLTLGSLGMARAAQPPPRPPAFGGPPPPAPPESSHARRDTPHSDITGVVTDRSTGQPARGVAVVINGAVVRTDGAGRYSLTGLAAGEYVLRLADLPAGWQPGQAQWGVWLDGRQATPPVDLDCFSQPRPTATPAAALLPETGGARANSWFFVTAGVGLLLLATLVVNIFLKKKVSEGR